MKISQSVTLVKLRAYYHKHLANSSAIENARNLFRKHLFMTNIGISFGLSGLGDVMQQKLEHSQSTASKPKLNLSRTLNMSTSFGLTSGFLCHFWYKHLDKALPGHGVKTVFTKIAWDQILFSPICIVACFFVACHLESKSNERLLSETVQLGGRLYLAEWFIWPPAQFFNFMYLPTRYRVLYDNMVSLVYDIYTSRVKHQVPVKERLFDRLDEKSMIPRPEHYYQATR